MSQVKLIASKDFFNRGAKIQKGETFTVSEGVVRDYLVNGLATKAEPTTEPLTQPTKTNDISHLKVGALRELASNKGIENVDTKSKQELIDILNSI